MRGRRGVLIGLVWAVLAGGLWAIAPPSNAADIRVRTIPALREWAAGGTQYQYAARSRVVAPAGLRAEATTLAADLAAMTGRRPEVLVDGQAATGDIQLALGETDQQLGDQGYRIRADGVLRVSGRTSTGVFHGTRSVLQLLKQDSAIPGGTGRDWPQHPERGILIDNKPRDFSVAWFTNLIKDLSYLKMNEVMLFGWRLSDTEITQLNQVARAYHVHITPLLGMPSWTAETLVAERPEFKLDPGAPDPVGAAFDFTKPGALDYAREWIERWIDKYDGPYWHTGSDEFLGYPHDQFDWDRYPQLGQFARARTGNPNATGADAFKWYLNWVNDIVRAHGKVTRAWNDGMQHTQVVQLNPNIVIEHWVTPFNRDSISPQEFAEAGHQVYNFNSEYLYYDNGWRQLDPALVYNEFTVDHFAGDDVYVTGPAQARLQGARFAVWNDGDEETNEEIAANLFAPLRSLAQVVWGSPKPAADYSGFAPLVRTLGRAPGWVSSGGDIVGAPIALQDGTGRLSWFARTSGGLLRHGWQDTPGGDWLETRAIASGLTGQPAVALSAGQLSFVARTTSGQLLHSVQQGPGSWGVPVAVATGVAGDPALLDDGSGLTYLVRASNGSLRVGDQVGSSWTSTSVGSDVAGDPVAALDAAGRLVFVARRTDGGLLFGRRSSTGTWTTSVLANGVVGRPALVRDAGNRLAYFARDTSGRLLAGREQTAGGIWSSAVVRATGLAGDPRVIEDLNGRMTYFVRTTAGGLLHGWQLDPGGGTWNSAVILDRLAGDPSVSEDAVGKLIYFVSQEDGQLIHGWQDSPGNGPWHQDHLWNHAAHVVPALDTSGTQTYFATATYGYLLHGWEKSVGHTGTDWDREVLYGSKES